MNIILAIKPEWAAKIQKSSKSMQEKKPFTVGS